MATSTGKDGINRTNAVGRGLDFNLIDRLHQARRGEQESRVCYAARGRDYLATTSVNGFRRDICVEDLELDISDRFVAQGAFSSSPLKALNDAIPHGFQAVLNMNSYLKTQPNIQRKSNWNLVDV